MTTLSQQARALLSRARVVPVLTIERVEDAVPLARALVAGGVVTLEVTLRTEAAREAIAAIVKHVPEACVGVGTVLSVDDLARAADSGARFALSPGTTSSLLTAAAKGTLPFVPGVATAAEIMRARDYEFDAMKFFPAAQLGGMAALKALGGPFPQISFCPTGGIGANDFRDWLSLPNVIAVGGSWLAPSPAVHAGDWAAITALARACG